VIRKTLHLIFFLVLFLAYVPFGLPKLKLSNLGDLNADVAYQLALPYFTGHLQFGEDLIFTYGPWGIILGRFSGPQFYKFVLFFHLALAATVSLSFYAISNRYNSRTGLVTVCFGAIALLMMWITGQRDSYFMFPVLLVVYHYLATSIIADKDEQFLVPWWEFLLWIVLSLLSGFLALAKFNIFVVASAAYILIMVDNLRRRRWPVLSLVYVVALVLSWQGAGQNLFNLPIYVSRSLDLSNGYADAMSKGFFIPYDAKLIALYYSAVGAIGFIAMAAAARHRWRFPALLSLLFTLLILGVSVKHGIGGNQIEQSLALLFMALCFVLVFFYLTLTQNSEFKFHKECKVVVCFVVVSILCLSTVATSTNFPISSLRKSLTTIGNKISLVRRSPREIFSDDWAATLAESHKFWQHQIGANEQTIDVYPQQTGLVLGRDGLRYLPRPAFLSLNAHTLDLAMLNARHLEKSTSPSFILFGLLPKEWTVNNRHPALADGPSWPILLSKYTPVKNYNDFILLKKREIPLKLTKKILNESSKSFGETISVTQDPGSLLFDDTHPNWVYKGIWDNFQRVGGAYNDTVAVSSDHAAVASIQISGTAFRIRYSKEPNRGTIAVFVDGKKVDDLNSFSTTVIRQAVYERTGLNDGAHTIEIRHGGGGGMIDIDAIEAYSPISTIPLIWASIEVKRSLSGNIIHQIYKSPHILMEIHTNDNTTHVFQIVPELGKSGFLLSPLVKNNLSFVRLYPEGRKNIEVEAANNVRSIKVVSPEAPDFFWEKTFTLSLWALEMY